MQDIQNKALETFGKNLEFLNKTDEALANKIAYLQSAIESGEYKENYSLEYKDGYFDVQNLHDGSFLYGDNSLEISQKKADELSFDKVNSVISLAYRNSYTKQTAQDFESFSAVNLTMMPPIEYILSEAGGRGSYINKIYKFAFFGLGLGLHVKLIDEKIKAASYLFVEDNLELFYLSLFVTPYYEINDKAKLFFCILENNDGFKRVFDDFYADLWIRNDFLKFSLFSDAYANKITLVQNQALIRPHIAYPANLMFRKNIRISKVLSEGYKFLRINQIWANSPLANKKVLLLAGGPSLNKHIKWVKEHRDKFFIIAVFMISKRLKKESIKPDLFVHIDENEEPIQRTLQGFDDLSYFENTRFILAGSVPLEYFTKLAKKEDIYLVEDKTRYKIDHGYLDFYSVGEASYGLSLILGANELYLLGLDLALDAKTGKTHAEGHASSNKELDLNAKDEVQEVGKMDESVFSVTGNRGESVPTTPLFAASITAFNSYSQACLVNNQKVYNLSDGAYLQGTQPLLVEDVKFTSDGIDTEKMYEFLDGISTDEFSEDEKENIFIRKQELKKKIKIIKKFASAKIKNKNDFHENLIQTLDALTKPADKNLDENSSIFTYYLQSISSFLGEYLNTKGADFSPNMLNQIRNKLASELRRFVAAFGYMSFDYLDAHAYFKPQICSELEQKVFKLDKFYASHYSQAKEICFSERLRNDFDGKLLEGVELVPLEEKKGIGFLANNINIQDKECLAYLKEILDKVEEASLVAFYFETHQKNIINEEFKTYEGRVEFKRIEGIVDIANGCKIYVSNPCTSYLDQIIFSTLQINHIDAYLIWLELGKNDITIKEHQEKHYENYYKIILDNLDKLDIQNHNNSSYCNIILFNSLVDKFGIDEISIDENMRLSEMFINYLKIDFIKDEVLKEQIEMSKKIVKLF